MEHRGEILERAVRSADITITELAKKLKVSRPTLYNYFNRSGVHIEILLNVGKIIDHDFRPELRQFKEPLPQYTEPSEETELWKKKYFALLKEHNALKKKLDQINKK